MRPEDFIRSAFNVRHAATHNTRSHETMRAMLAESLKLLRCGYSPRWLRIYQGLQWMGQMARLMQYAAEQEIRILNQQRPPDQQLPQYRKPRFYPRKAPPKPRAISAADQETFLEGVLRWFDAMAAGIHARPGEYYPHLPPGLKAVLQRNGFDPHHHLSPMRLVKEYFK